MNYSTSTVGEIVAGDYRTAQVFRSFGLDFCCGGGAPVEEACSKKKVDPALVFKALEKLQDEVVSPEEKYNEWELGFLSDYIVNTHHQFVRGKLPEIGFYSTKVARVHGSRNPELIEMYHLFERLSAELLDHLAKEEEILFPYIKELTELKKAGEKQYTKPHFETAANPVAMMKEEHETAGEIMEQMENLSNGFTPPEEACTTYRVYFKNLKAFQEDLHKHVHLENNILFPKALRLEEELKAY